MDELIICKIIGESMIKVKEAKKKVSFVSDVKFKVPSYAYHQWRHIFFTKNTWIRDLGASCHITNNDTGFYDITDIN